MTCVCLSRVPERLLNDIGFLTLGQSHVLEYGNVDVDEGGDKEGYDGVEDHEDDHDGEEDYEGQLREHCCVHLWGRVCGVGELVLRRVGGLRMA